LRYVVERGQPRLDRPVPHDRRDASRRPPSYRAAPLLNVAIAAISRRRR